MRHKLNTMWMLARRIAAALALEFALFVVRVYTVMQCYVATPVWRRWKAWELGCDLEDLDTTRCIRKRRVYTVCDGHVVDVQPFARHKRRGKDFVDAVEYWYDNELYVLLTDDGTKFNEAEFHDTKIPLEDAMMAECDRDGVKNATLKVEYQGAEVHMDVTQHVRQLHGPLRDFHFGGGDKPEFDSKHVLEYLAVAACNDMGLEYDQVLYFKTLTIEYFGGVKRDYIQSFIADVFMSEFYSRVV